MIAAVTRTGYQVSYLIIEEKGEHVPARFDPAFRVHPELGQAIVALPQLIKACAALSACNLEALVAFFNMNQQPAPSDIFVARELAREALSVVVAR